jgi:hypothetical protein
MYPARAGCGQARVIGARFRQPNRRRGRCPTALSLSLRRLKAASAQNVSRLPQLSRRQKKGKTGLREEPGFREPAWGAGYIYQRGTNCTPLDLGGYGWRCSEVDYAEMQRRNNRGSRMSAMSFRECG